MVPSTEGGGQTRGLARDRITQPEYLDNWSSLGDSVQSPYRSELARLYAVSLIVFRFAPFYPNNQGVVEML
jgi:hypothetical protein